MIRYANLNDTVYFWFGLNAITGGGDDGASPTFAVRLGGASSSDAPTYTGTPTLLTHASYTPGSYEIEVPATSGNGFAAAGNYGVFSSALVSSVNPTGFVGALNLAPVLSDVESLSAGALTDIVDGVWDEPLASHLIAGSTGEGLNEAATHAIAGDPWTKTLPGIYSPGEAGYIVGTNIDALISSRMATYTQPTGFLAATFPGTVASPTNITAGTITTATNVTTISANGITATSISTGAQADIASAVWDANLSSYQDPNTTGEALGVAGSGGDPWGTAVPGAYPPGSAGYRVGTYLDASISGVNANINGLQEATIIRDAVNVVQFPMYLSGTDDDPAIGKTVTAQVSDETGAYGPCTGTVTEIGLGAYAFTASIADCATESGSFMFSATGCKNTLYPFKTSE